MNTDKIFGKFARECIFLQSESASPVYMNAYISPLRYKNKMYLYGVNTQIGYNSEGYYLYVGPALPDITECENSGCIRCGNDRYRIDRAEKVYAGKDVLYIWAVIRKNVDPEDEEDDE